ncbi:MAG: ABC transporter permease subunit, partial [Alphaproteobacteria bacterium]|nr:ABC transporter permease subunit [Alphaproteobacteria bacterium]
MINILSLKEKKTIKIILCFIAFYLILTIFVPLFNLLIKSFYTEEGTFVGVDNYFSYFTKYGVVESIWHSLIIALSTGFITTFFAFICAYALQHSTLKNKKIIELVISIPLFCPSLLPGLGLIYLFGNQGLIKFLLPYPFYGPFGIIMGEVFYSFPYAVLILMTSLSLFDQRLFDAAYMLRTSKLRIFTSIIWPICKSGLFKTFLIVFITSLTDFGVPAIVGGNYRVLATDIYQYIIGQYNFSLGSVVAVLLLLPSLMIFCIDYLFFKKQKITFMPHAIPYQPKPSMIKNSILFILSLIPA